MNKYCILFLIIFSSHASSFDASKHKPITVDAFKLYKECRIGHEGKLKYQFTDEDIAIVADANKGVDTPWPPRLWNWHFYDSAYDYKSDSPGHIEENFLGMRRSLHKYHSQKTRDFEATASNAGKQSLLKKTGVLMHFVQDMAVPAHVAPIYHVGPLSKDRLDGYQPKNPKEVSISPMECENFIENMEDPIEILEKQATSTLSEIRKEINATLSWNDFWNIYPEKNGTAKPGFSTYGKCGEDGFGNIANKKCPLTEDEYDNFYNSRYEEAVKSSLRLLIYLIGKDPKSLQQT